MKSNLCHRTRLVKGIQLSIYSLTQIINENFNF